MEREREKSREPFFLRFGGEFGSETKRQRGFHVEVLSGYLYDKCILRSFILVWRWDPVNANLIFFPRAADLGLPLGNDGLTEGFGGRESGDALG